MSLSLTKNIKIIERTRPIRFAYLVPIFEDPTEVNTMLDAIFAESYSRWGGVGTAIIPVTTNGIISLAYMKYLSDFDPDYLYSYVDLTKDSIKKLENNVQPILFLKHNSSLGTGKNWQKYMPQLSLVISPVSSSSLINSCHFELQKGTALPKMLTLLPGAEERFITDNFGFLMNRDGSSAWLDKNLYKTIYYANEQLPDNHYIHPNDEYNTSLRSVFYSVSINDVITVFDLAQKNATSRYNAYYDDGETGFLLFIGNSPQDRINFWNSRLISRRLSKPRYNALILEEDIFKDREFVEEIRNFLLKNPIYSTPSCPVVKLISSSVSKESLELARDLLSATEQPINIHFEINASNINVIPVIHKNRHRAGNSIQITETEVDIISTDPIHFQANKFSNEHYNKGLWAIDLSIERHNSNCEIINETDFWQLSKKYFYTSCFTDNKNRVNASNELTIIPDILNRTGSALNGEGVMNIRLNLPEDLTVFNAICIPPTFHGYNHNDLRKNLLNPGFHGLRLSVRGKRLAGIIKMLGGINNTFRFVTNIFWRKLVMSAISTKKERENDEKILIEKNITYAMNELSGSFGNEMLRHYTENIGQLTEKKDIQKYLKSAFNDGIECLIKHQIFSQVHEWPCDYCGFNNILKIDNVCQTNKCQICNTEKFLPIDFTPKLLLNKYILQSLWEHDGLIELWALGYLNRFRRSEFCFIPSVELIDEKGKVKNEIDGLVFRHGQFGLLEAKTSPSEYLLKNTQDINSLNLDKLITVTNKINPEILFLVFENFKIHSEEIEQELKTNIQKKIYDYLHQSLNNGIAIEIIIAEDTPEYNELPYNFSFDGQQDRANDFCGRRLWMPQNPPEFNESL